MFRFPLYLLLVYDLCVFILANMLGPADMVFKRTEHCDPECRVIDFWAEQRKYNRSTEVMDITISSSIDLNELVIVELKGWMKKEGGYKPGTFYYKDTFCKALDKLLGEIFMDILHMAGLEDCPMPANKYEALDFYFDNEKFTVPQVWGEYKMEVFLTKDEELLGCYAIYYDMTEKQNTGLKK